MSKDNNGKGVSKNGGKGYGKPPKEYQFKKGQSGNPGGRPKGAKNKKKIEPLSNADEPLLGSDQPTRKLILQEAYRNVRVREGERIIEMPINQAIIRAMQQKALKGCRHSQREFMMIVRQIEADQKFDQLDGFKVFVEYKQDAENEIARCKALGNEPPEMIPHPDDIEINPRLGTYALRGPMTIEEKRDQDKLLEQRDEIQKVIKDIAKSYRRTRNEERKSKLLDIWHFLQEQFDMANGLVGGRYQAILEDRSYEPGASQPQEPPE